MLGRPNTGSAGLESPKPDLGFKRIWAVRVSTGVGPARYEVEGVVHRHPVTRPVTAAMATRLVAAGVPLLTRDRGTSEDDRC
jgi:hypothetical protein